MPVVIDNDHSCHTPLAFALWHWPRLTAGVGGVVYCLRGLYVNTCVGDGWNPKWMPWYFIRPVVSLVCGVVSYLLLKAGLLVLNSAPREATNHMGFYVLAFISGLNVDKFLTKIEEIAQTTWGIEKSRSARRDERPTASPSVKSDSGVKAEETKCKRPAGCLLDSI